MLRDSISACSNTLHVCIPPVQVHSARARIFPIDERAAAGGQSDGTGNPSPVPLPPPPHARAEWRPRALHPQSWVREAPDAAAPCRMRFRASASRSFHATAHSSCLPSAPAASERHRRSIDDAATGARARAFSPPHPSHRIFPSSSRAPRSGRLIKTLAAVAAAGGIVYCVTRKDGHECPRKKAAAARKEVEAAAALAPAPAAETAAPAVALADAAPAAAGATESDEDVRSETLKTIHKFFETDCEHCLEIREKLHLTGLMGGRPKHAKAPEAPASEEGQAAQVAQ